MEELIGLVAVAGGFVAPIVVVYLVLLFTNRKLAMKSETLLKLVEKGVNVEPDLMRMLSEPSGPTVDLRKGLVWLAIGIPLVLGLLMVPEGPPWVFGLIPVLIGVAYLIMMKLGHENHRA